MESNNEGKEDALPVPPDLKDAKNSPKRAGKDVANFLFQTERGLSFLEESNPTIPPSVDETTQNEISSPISSNKENHGSSTSVKSPSNNNKKKRTPWLTLSPSSRRKTKQAPAIPQESAPPPTKRKQPREVIEIITVAEGIEAVKMAEQRDFSRTFSFENVVEDLSEGDATPTTNNNNSSNSRLQTTTEEEEGVEVERRNPFEDPELIQKYQHTSTTTKEEEEEHNNSDKPKWWKKAPQIVLSPFRKNKKKTDETTRSTPAEEEEDAPTTNHFVLESAPEPKHIIEEEEEEEEAKEEIQQEIRVEEMFPFHHQTDNDPTIPQKAMVMMMDDSDTDYHATTTQTTANSPTTTTTQKQWIASVALSSILVCLLTLRYIPTFDTLCGPVMHGTTLDLSNLQQSEQEQSLLQAPWWWAGGNEPVFSLVCGAQRPRIQLEWKPHTPKTGRLVLTDLDDAKKTHVLLDKKNLVSVEIGLSGGTSSSSSSSKPIITAIDKGGKSHVLPAPW
ncbi:expressed unknown protein [Seminavis robusta]|uniref:Uncharacterized protein n=1 Tax=Seminavis robusta TaxID=568900 RepID=A0A9N8F2A2_9STRA|nr:expressed unknown protein [Seminavis robusta]|eukprot:Sro2973_g341240.1 n/a (504) ;mRNA; f:2277-3788